MQGDFHICISVSFNSFEMTLDSKHGTGKIKTKNLRNRNIKNENTERRKPSFTIKIQVENEDLYKLLPNKTMTTRKNCIKYNFVAPLTTFKHLCGTINK